MANRGSQYADAEKARDAVKLQKRRWRARTGSGGGRKIPWTKAEDARVLAHEVTDRELSAQIGRSVQAIHIRRCRLRAGEVG